MMVSKAAIGEMIATGHSQSPSISAFKFVCYACTYVYSDTWMLT